GTALLLYFMGEGESEVDGKLHPFVPGTTVVASPWLKHKIINTRARELKMTWTMTPPGLETYFRKIGRPRNGSIGVPLSANGRADTCATECPSPCGPSYATINKCAISESICGLIEPMCRPTSVGVKPYWLHLCGLLECLLRFGQRH